MKRNMLEEIEVVRKERDRVTLENTRLDNQLDRLAAEKESLASQLMESQDSISILRQQVLENITMNSASLCQWWRGICICLSS